MPRTKDEDAIIINDIFPERYSDYQWEVKTDKDKTKAMEHFTVNTCEVDSKYEFLTEIENENKVKVSTILKSKKIINGKIILCFLLMLEYLGWKLRLLCFLN